MVIGDVLTLPKTAKIRQLVRLVMYRFIITVPAEFYWASS